MAAQGPAHLTLEEAIPCPLSLEQRRQTGGRRVPTASDAASVKSRLVPPRSFSPGQHSPTQGSASLGVASCTGCPLLSRPVQSRQVDIARSQPELVPRGIARALGRRGRAECPGPAGCSRGSDGTSMARPRTHGRALGWMGAACTGRALRWVGGALWGRPSSFPDMEPWLLCPLLSNCTHTCWRFTTPTASGAVVQLGLRRSPRRSTRAELVRWPADSAAHLGSG